MANHSTISSFCVWEKFDEDLDADTQDAIRLIYKRLLLREASILPAIQGSGKNFQKNKDLSRTPKTSFTAPQRKIRPLPKHRMPLSAVIEATQGKINKNVQWFKRRETMLLAARKEPAHELQCYFRLLMWVWDFFNAHNKYAVNKTVNCSMGKLKETTVNLTDEVSDSKVEKDNTKVFLVFSGGNPLAPLSLNTSLEGLEDSCMEDPIKHIFSYNIIQLQGSPQAPNLSNAMIRYSRMATAKFPIFLVFFNPSGIQGFPTGIIRNKNLAVFRLTDGGRKIKFQDRPTESLPSQIFPPELIDKMINPRLFPRLIFKIAMDSIAKEVALCSFNQKNAVKALLLKKVLAAEFQNDRAAHLYKMAAAALCRGKAPISFCQFAGLELLSQILSHWNEVGGKEIKISDFTRSDLGEVISNLAKDIPDPQMETNSFESVLSEYEDRAESERHKFFEDLFSNMEKRGEGKGSDILKTIDYAYGTTRLRPIDNKAVTVYDKIIEVSSVVDKGGSDICDKTSTDEESDWSDSYIEDSFKKNKPCIGKISYYRVKKSK